MEADSPKDTTDLAEMAREVLTLCAERDLCLATAESCTGGLLASLLTDVEGVSSCFEAGIIAYSNEAKTILLGVAPSLLQQHGAVSREAARAMVQGIFPRTSADLAVAVTGFAGPAGPDDEEGLVYLAVANGRGYFDARECHFGKIGRDGVRHRATHAALAMLKVALGGIE